MPASEFALQHFNQTSPYANYTANFNSNASDPCMRHNNVILDPLDFNGTAYVAVGPISNFTSSFQSCCNMKTADPIQNYDGGNNRGKAPEYDSPKSCFYYCTFNGTYRDVDAVLNCTMQKAEAIEAHDRYILAASPDWPGESGGVRIGAKIGVWKWAVLGLVVMGTASL